MNWVGHRLRVIGVSGIFIMIMAWPIVGYAASTGPLLLQLKVTSTSQFVTIYNNADTVTTATYQLVYYNNAERSKATSSKVYTVNVALGAKGYYIFNDGPLDLCQQAVVDSVSLGFSTASGSIELVRLEPAGGAVVVSSVRWVSKAPTDGVQVLPTATSGYQAFLQYSLQDTVWSAVQAPLSSPCSLQTIVTSTSPAPTLPQGQVPKVNVQTASEASLNRNAGLKAPVINELLPNPKSPLTDNDDEFIELYNPNDTAFQLEGYRLQVGVTSQRSYTFTAEDVLPPKSYVAFTSAITGLALSNSGSQASLVDPNNSILSASAVYGQADEGQSWSLANGQWRWLLLATPNKPNDGVTAEPIQASQIASSEIFSSTSSPETVAKANAKNNSQQEDVMPLHPTVLAGIGVSAVGYGLYEYRRDIANRIFQLKRYFKLRSEARSKLQRG